MRGRRTNGLYHGECVALGMLPMIEDRKLQKRARAVLRKLELPVRTGLDKQKVLAQMQHDKKSGGDYDHGHPRAGAWLLARRYHPDVRTARPAGPGNARLRGRAAD